MLTQQYLDELWDFDDPVASEARLRDAASTSDDREALLTQVARALGLQSRFDEAHDLLDSLVDDGVRVPLERGRLYNSAGDPAAAVPLFTRAAENASGFLEVDALHMLAIADSANALAWTQRGLAAVDASTDERVKRWATSLHNNYGWTLYDAGEMNEALESFRAALTAAVTDAQRSFVQEAIAEVTEELAKRRE